MKKHIYHTNGEDSFLKFQGPFRIVTTGQDQSQTISFLPKHHQTAETTDDMKTY